MTLFVGGPYHGRDLPIEPLARIIRMPIEKELDAFIGEKLPGMDMISFGPQIEFPHSPDERVKIDSVARFYDLLLSTLNELTRTR